jgi:PTH1 family peptidyl-tRNA hydrolase
MGLFHREHISHTATGLYTIGQQQTILIVGLGNMGKEYEGTRHNIGFEITDYFAKQQEFPDWQDKKDLKCRIAAHTIGATRVILAKPTTFMNLSGEGVQAIQNYYKIYNQQTLVVHDELDIPFGQIRVRQGGASAGHNGLKSLIQLLGEDFYRVRIGIGPKMPEQMDSSDYVLAKFSADQNEKMTLLNKEASSIISEFIAAGSLQPDTRNFLL